MDLVSIIIPVFNGINYTLQCIKSILEHSCLHFELIIVDNGSTDSTVKVLQSFSEVQLISNSENLGFAAGCNQGIDRARGSFLLLLNNDTIVGHSWLENLLSCLNSHAEIGLVGPRSNYSATTGIPNLSFSTVDEIHKFMERFNRPDPGKWFEVQWLPGFCLLFRRELIDTIGLLDRSYSYGFMEDVDFCLSAKRAGYRSICAGDTFVYHYGSRTFIGNSLDQQQIYDDNAALFNKKWKSFIK
ncbi:MAG: glycosyltransferase family 2 protein [Bacillota bacterium]